MTLKELEKYLRKRFNKPTKRESELISDGYNKLMKMAEEISSKHFSKEYENKKIMDSICPNCKGDKIVNKISRVEGSGNVSGSFYFGNGSIYGSSSIDTNEINHCNNCGNQWKKYKPVYKHKSDVLVGWTNDLDTVAEGRYKYAESTIELLKDIPAESILAMCSEQFDVSGCYSSASKNVTLSFLRSKFKSVYD